MNKRGYDISRKLILSMILAVATSFLSACNDSEIVHKNTQIKQLKSYNSKLESIKNSAIC